MAKRKKEDEAGGALVLFVFGVIYYYTKSLSLSITIFLCLLSLLIGLIFWKSNRERKRLRLSGIHQIDQMDGYQFERYLAELYRSNGYKVKLTQERGDYGADLILKTDQKTIVVQAKRYKKSVGINAIQEISAAAPYYKASESWVVTNNTFTKPAINLAASNGVKLIDREKLVEHTLVLNSNPQDKAKNTLDTVKAKEIKCSNCGGSMSVKKGKYGRFYGCNNYPNCRDTKAL